MPTFKKINGCRKDVNGYKYWYVDNRLHRENGPAIEHSNGYKQWWLYNKHYLEPDYYRELYNRGKITREELFIHLL